MNKAEIVCELMQAREVMRKIDSTSVEQHNKLCCVYSKILKLIDKLTSDEPDCQSCPAMKKVEELTDTIEQALLISQECNQPFKVSVIERECKS